MTTWIEPPELLRLAEETLVRGAEPFEHAIMRRPAELIPVTDAAVPPLDLATYEARQARWHAGEGPTVHGIDKFVDCLKSLVEPARAVSVSGELTTYIFLLNAEMDRVIAAVAIDPPASSASS